MDVIPVQLSGQAYLTVIPQYHLYTLLSPITPTTHSSALALYYGCSILRLKCQFIVYLLIVFYPSLQSFYFISSRHTAGVWQLFQSVYHDDVVTGGRHTSVTWLVEQRNSVSLHCHLQFQRLESALYGYVRTNL